MADDNHKSVCDIVLAKGHELVPTINMSTRIIEVPRKAEHDCAGCKHYLSYGYGHYCVRTPHWKGHKEYGRAR